MQDEVTQDLKQFIATTVSREGSSIKSDLKAELVAEFRNDMGKMEKSLSGQINDLSQSVADAIENTNSTIDVQLKDHNRRITKLERKLA